MGFQFLYPRLPHLNTLAINFSPTGDNIVIPSIASTRLLIHRLWLVASAATSLTFKNGSTSLSGPISMSANGGLTFDITGEPWFTTSLGSDFIINQTGTAQLGGMVYYATST